VAQTFYFAALVHRTLGARLGCENDLHFEKSQPAMKNVAIVANNKIVITGCVRHMTVAAAHTPQMVAHLRMPLA